MKKALAILAAALVAAVGLKLGSSLLNPPADKTLIAEAVAAAVKDSREGKPGSVVDLISKNLVINDQTSQGDPRQVSEFIRKARPDVTIERPDPTITGDEARIVSPVMLEASFLGQRMERRMGEVTLVLRKEEDRDWLIIPRKTWKLVEVRVPETSIADLVSPGF